MGVRTKALGGLAGLGLWATTAPALAQPSDADPAATAWMLAATALVLLMSAATAGLLWALIEWRRL